MAQGGRPPPGGWGVICQPGPGCHKIAKHAVLVLSEWPAARGKRNSEGNKLNAVEIEEAISAMAEQFFDAQEFPFAFLQAFGNKETTTKRLRSGASNKSDLGGVLQTNNTSPTWAASSRPTISTSRLVRPVGSRKPLPR